MSRCLSCRGKADDDNFGSMKSPTPHSRPTASASILLRHRCAHFHSIALAFSLPVLAAMLAFVTYTETSKQFDGAVLFASFTLFQGKTPFPLTSSRTLVAPSYTAPSASATPLPLADVHSPLLSSPARTNDVPSTHPLCHRNALVHLSLVFHAPLREGALFVVDPKQEAAVWAKGGVGVGGGGEGEGNGSGEKEKQNEEQHAHEPDEPPFVLHDITLSILRGTLAAVVGRVGSGKSSLLKGLIGEMLPTDTRHWQEPGVLSAVGVDPECDFEGQRAPPAAVRGGEILMRHRGFVFAPGVAAPRRWGLDRAARRGSIYRKQHVNIARALYYGMDVVIFDDPLSAVDGNVRKALFRSAIQGLVAQDKTVLLVAHALHLLVQYPELIARGGEFARLDRKFGGAKAEDGDEAQVQVVSVENAFHRQCSALPNDPHSIHHNVHANDLTEDHAIVAKRTELAQRMKMWEGVRKDLMAFEK
ncbi:P-loop containing nucleoside triphosphate hydrolase protein [Mycena leptocephala]|nr:P-loop containing nucleoside triphosphate hydrolase protein [Mycena leptocephala]